VDSPRTRIRRKNHYHKRKPSHLPALPQDKKETIYCFKGEVDIILNNRVVTLKEGEDVTLPPKTIHRINGKKN
jgi:oxalate decarboxylase/phosphoglucose isomerase-like protein (cupin superfamily)